jgi:hypothetical protein
MIYMDKIKILELAQKIILDSRLYQYVIYKSTSKSVEEIVEKFNGSDFIV